MYPLKINKNNFNKLIIISQWKLEIKQLIKPLLLKLKLYKNITSIL